MPDIEWDQGFLDDCAAGKYDWVAYLVCPDCNMTWRGILPNERPSAFGPIEEQCPDCELELDGTEDIE